MAPRLRERRGGNGPVNQLENKSSHHERLLSLTRTAGNAANWPVASRRSFWSRDPQAPHPPHWPALESSSSVCMLRFKRDWFYSLLPLRRLFQHSTLCIKMMKRTSSFNIANSPSFSELHQEGQTDIFPGAERGGGMRAYHWDPVHFSSTAADAAHQGYFAFAAYRGHLMRFTSPTHTCTHPAPARNARLSLVPRGHGRCSDTPWRAPGSWQQPIPLHAGKYI